MEKKVHLQQIGKVKAIEAGNITVGMTLVWNFGTTSKVIDIKPRGNSQIVITEAYESGTYQRILSKKRLVAFA